MAWAVPAYRPDERTGLLSAADARGRGRFWSFFPTKYEMTLSGILNGAWKTNEDRQNLLDSSPFNVEMIRVAANLVVASLPDPPAIILVTGYPTLDTALAAIDLGLAGYLVKPFEIGELVKRIDAAMRRRALTAQREPVADAGTSGPAAGRSVGIEDLTRRERVSGARFTLQDEAEQVG